MRKSKKIYSSSSTDSDSDRSESDSFEIECGSFESFSSDSEEDDRQVDVSAQPAQEDRIMKAGDSTESDFRVNTIPVRKRTSEEKKWMLDE